MATRITGQPPPQQPAPARETQRPATKKADDTRGVQATATVQMEALAQRVKSGKAVAGASLLTQHADEADPLAAQVQKGLVTGRWAITGVLDDDQGGRRGGDGGGYDDVPDIPLEDIPYEVATSPLGRAYRAVRWLKTVAEVEKRAATLALDASPALLDAIAAVRAHQDKRRAASQIEMFFRSERQRLQVELNKELGALLAAGKTITQAQLVETRRLALPSGTLSTPPTLEPGTLENAPTEGPSRTGDTLGGGGGTLADLVLLLADCADRKNQLIDECAEPEARWHAVKIT